MEHKRHEKKEQRDATTEKVAKEQQTIKEKAQQTWQSAQKVWNGEKELPTTEKLGEVLKRGEKALQSLQTGERGQQLGDKQHLVCLYAS